MSTDGALEIEILEERDCDGSRSVFAVIHQHNPPSSSLTRDDGKVYRIDAPACTDDFMPFDYMLLETDAWYALVSTEMIVRSETLEDAICCVIDIERYRVFDLDVRPPDELVREVVEEMKNLPDPIWFEDGNTINYR